MNGRMAKITAIVAVLILLVVIVGVNFNFISINTSDHKVIDVRGREVPVHNNVERVVCLSAGSVRLMSYFGAVDKIVGIDDSDADAFKSPKYNFATYRIVHSEIKKINLVGSEENYKAIIDANPDVVITSMASTQELNVLQENTGIPVVAIAADGDIAVGGEMFKRNIKLIGEVLNNKNRSDEIINGVDAMITELNTIANTIPDEDEKNAYIGGLMYMMEGGFTMTTGNYLPFDLTGVENMMPFKQGNPYPTEPRNIRDKNPQYIFIDSVNYEESKKEFNENRNVLKDIDAYVKNSNDDKRMFTVFCEKYYGTNWESELINAYIIGFLSNPEYFDYDCEEKMNAVLKLFYPDKDIHISDIMEKQSHSFEWISDW